MTPRQETAAALTVAATPFVAVPTLICPCCSRMMRQPYGGPADRNNDGTDPCERCVLKSFADAG